MEPELQIFFGTVDVETDQSFERSSRAGSKESAQDGEELC